MMDGLPSNPILQVLSDLKSRMDASVEDSSQSICLELQACQNIRKYTATTGGGVLLSLLLGVLI